MPYKQLHEQFNQLFRDYLTDDVFPINTLTWNQIEQLAKDPLCTIGSHTMSHCRLIITDRESMSYELLQSKRILEQRIGKEVRHLSYPYGGEMDVSGEVKQFAREIGYRIVPLAGGGPIRRKDKDIDMYSLKRIAVKG